MQIKTLFNCFLYFLMSEGWFRITHQLDMCRACFQCGGILSAGYYTGPCKGVLNGSLNRVSQITLNERAHLKKKFNTLKFKINLGGNQGEFPGLALQGMNSCAVERQKEDSDVLNSLNFVRLSDT